jgi:hypothetical protein
LKPDEWTGGWEQLAGGLDHRDAAVKGEGDIHEIPLPDATGRRETDNRLEMGIPC